MDLSFPERLNAARHGATSALGILLEAYRPFVRLLADQEWPTDLQAKLGSSDLVQETYLEAARDFAAFQGTTEAEFAGWLERILHHNAINLAQSYRQAEKRRIDKEVPLDDPGRGIDLHHKLPSREETPSKNVMQQEAALAMMQALGRLSEDHRLVIQLRHEQHLAFSDIAQRMRRSEQAVRKLWARAVESWRQEVDRSQDARPDTTSAAVR